jgi:hypothetical protein
MLLHAFERNARIAFLFLLIAEPDVSKLMVSLPIPTLNLLRESNTISLQMQLRGSPQKEI